MIEICDQLNNEPPFRGLRCIFNTFKKWVEEDQKLKYPVPEEDFDALIGEFYVQSGEMLEQYLGFIKGKLVFIRLVFEVPGFRNMDREESVALYDRIEALITSINEKSGPGLNKGF